MIIFDMDVLANCEHRRHFVDPQKNNDVKFDSSLNNYVGGWIKDGKKWQPDWRAFYDACDKDQPIQQAIEVFRRMMRFHVQIWTGRCESVREKTKIWIDGYVANDIFDNHSIELKMRPIGDERPQEQLFEEWCRPSRTVIDMVFTSDPASIAMFRRRGIFVFDCKQDGKEF